MSKITYGGIELGYIKTTVYKNEPDAELDKPDLKYRVTTLQVTSVLAVGVVPALDGETTQDILIRVTHELERPRRPFRYEVAGQVVIDLPGGVDDANGPFTHGVTVNLVADASFVITWGITLRTADCNGNLNKILSNRWSESVTINDDHLSVFRRSGRLVVAGRHGISPDAYRSLVTPKIGPMFARKSAQYTLHENGLELAYEFIDEEKYILPPYPAIKAKGRMSETATSNIGAKRYGRVWIELTGPPDVDKKVLLAKCIDIAISRAMQAGLQNENGRFIAGGGIDEDLFENKIALTVNWMMRTTTDRLLSNRSTNGALQIGISANLQGGNPQGVLPNPPKLNDRNVDAGSLAMKGGWVGRQLPGTYTGYGIAPPTRGDVEWLQLVSAAFHDPCLQNTFASDDRSKAVTDPNKGINTLFPTALVSVASVLPPETTSGSIFDPLDRSDALYDHYSATCRYVHDDGVDVTTPLKSGVAGKKIRLAAESLRLEVEFSARRVGKPPEIPSPKSPTGDGTSQDAGWVYLGGTINPEMIDIAADGVSMIHSVSGLLRFKACNPCVANIISPLPPYLARSVQDEARMAASLTNANIVFLSGPNAGQPLNPFCGYSTQLVSGNGQGPIAGSGGLPFV